jgi:methylthioribulose-1-phosphate dehydratase
LVSVRLDTSEPPTLDALARAIAELGRRAHARGWLPATSGNLSARIDANTLAITSSGRDKGALAAGDIIAVDLEGKLVAPGPLRPSAETLLHCQLYAHSAAIGAVLHTHSRAATLLSRARLGAGEVVLQDFELAKALAGVHTHQGRVRLPVVANHQDMQVLSRVVAPLLAAEPPLHGYLIAGHGLYTWGRDLTEAFRHLEALEFMLECALWEGRAP